MKKILTILKWGFILLLVVIVVLLIGINIFTNQAEDSMYDQIENDINETDDYFIVNGAQHDTTIVYYPGGLVTPESYLLQADMLASNNFRVIIPKMPFNLAILNRFVFLDIYDNNVGAFYLAGHSLGGASAAYVAKEHSDKLEGLIFLAAYPPSSVDLSNIDLPILSVSAEKDGVMNWDRYESTKSLLPDTTIYENIEGGNHAQFGYYGTQRGDNESAITVYEQHKIVTELIQSFVDSHQE